MRSTQGVLAIAMSALLVLTACARGEKTPQLMNIRSTTEGPDEFTIVPPRPLAMPESLTELPEPTPGGANRTDQNPFEDAITALGGKPNVSGKIGAGDAALVSYAARAGVAEGIRDTLASEDLDYRRNNNGKLLERLFDLNVYFKAYRPYALDQQAELARWRNVGARTPAAPPPPPAAK
jgi:hypothetical protein